MPLITEELRDAPYGNYICHTFQGGRFFCINTAQCFCVKEIKQQHVALFVFD